MPLDLVEFLQEHFPALSLAEPLFYSWPFGLRFELGPAASSASYFQEVNRRAASLYHAVFRPGDPCIIVEQEWLVQPATRRPRRFLSLKAFAAEQGIDLGAAVGAAESKDFDPTEEIGAYAVTWFQPAASTFRPEAILAAIANTDHRRTPALGNPIFFVNPRIQAIMKMYDDRGLDVIATEASALRPLYRDFQSWILEFDRHRIDAVFKAR